VIRKITKQKEWNFDHYDFYTNKIMNSGPLSGRTGLWQEDKLSYLHERLLGSWKLFRIVR
jgi:hypothetical protein